MITRLGTIREAAQFLVDAAAFTPHDVETQVKVILGALTIRVKCENGLTYSHKYHCVVHVAAADAVCLNCSPCSNNCTDGYVEHTLESVLGEIVEHMDGHGFVGGHGTQRCSECERLLKLIGANGD